MTVIYLPEARAELVNAALAVDEFSGRGAAFDAEVRLLEAAIIASPEAYPIDAACSEGVEARCARVGRYPWRLVFIREGETLLVVAVAHLRRRPGYWRERLGER